MTAEEKRERRTARHEVQAALKRVAVRRLGLHATGPQIRHGLRTLTDRYYREQIMPAVERIQAQTLASQSARAVQSEPEA